MGGSGEGGGGGGCRESGMFCRPVQSTLYPARRLCHPQGQIEVFKCKRDEKTGHESLECVLALKVGGRAVGLGAAWSGG